MDAAEPLSPGSAQQLVQHRLRLVVQGVRGGHRVRPSIHHQLPEEGIAKIACGLLQGLMEGSGRGRRIGAMQMEWQLMSRRQLRDKCRVFVGGGSANAVMHVGNGKDNAGALLEHAAQQGHGVGAPGDSDGNPLAGTKKTGAESWRLHLCAYVRAVSQREREPIRSAVDTQ